MSDASGDIEATEVPSPAPREAPSAKKPMSEAKAKALEAARAKAWEKRKELGALRKQEDELDRKVKERELAVRKKKVAKALEGISDSDDDEPPPRPKTRRPATPAVSPKVPLEDLASLPTSVLTAAIAREELKRRLQVDSEQIAWASLFPGHAFPGSNSK